MSKVCIAACGLLATPIQAQLAQIAAMPPSLIMLQCDGVANVTDANQSQITTHATTTGQATAFGAQGAVTASGQSETSGSGTDTTFTDRQIAVRFVFELSETAARVRFPKVMIPTLHSGNDKAGWWVVKDFEKDGASYKGRIGLNFLNKSRFTIDRRSGDFDLRGGRNMDARGFCTKIDTSSDPQF